MTNGTSETNGADRPREQKLAFYHPNSTGTGAALQLEPRVNRREGDRYNCFFMDMAAQKTAPGCDGGRRVPATFDWEHKLTVKLEFADICELLTVLDGCSERAGGQRNGLYHENSKASTVITFQRSADKGGYLLGLSRKDKTGGQQPFRIHMVLTEGEAIGLRSVFQIGLFLVTFHAHLFRAAATPEADRPRG